MAEAGVGDQRDRGGVWNQAAVWACLLSTCGLSARPSVGPSHSGPGCAVPSPPVSCASSGSRHGHRGLSLSDPSDSPLDPCFPSSHTPPTSLTSFRFLSLVPLPSGRFPSLVSQPALHLVPWILQPHLLTQIWLLLCPHCLFLDSGQHPPQAGRPHQPAVQRSLTHFPHCRGVFLKILVFPG